MICYFNQCFITNFLILHLFTTDNRTRYTSNTSDSFDSEDFQSEDASLTTSQEENLRSTTDGIPSVTLEYELIANWR